MGWPFTGVTAPNVDTGYVTLTASYADLPSIVAGPFWPVSGYIFNPTAASVDLDMKDSAGAAMVPTIPIPAGGTFDIPESWFAMPLSGPPQWKGLALVGRMWGYQ